MPTAIVTDSTSDISPQQADQYHIHVIPTILIIDGKEYLDGQGISRQEYYRLLPGLNPPPTTASPSAGTFAEAYQVKLSQGYDHVVSIHVASPLSGVVTAAKVGAQEFGGRVTVVDSGSLSFGLGFQAIAGAEASAAGGSLAQVLAAIEDTRRRAYVMAMLDTLTQLKRSGRVSWARAGLGDLFKVKLFVEVREGEVLRLGQTRTRENGIARLGRRLSALGPLERLALLHTNAEADIRAFRDSLSLDVVHPPVVRNVTPVVGTHVGVNGLGFAAVVK
jgi:DegV family protein with EDD domain